MVNPVLNRITEGRYWVVKSLVLVTLAAFMFSCAPALLFLSTGFTPSGLPIEIGTAVCGHRSSAGAR